MIITDGIPAADRYDAVVIGTGPAGLSVAMALADAGRRVLAFESGGHQQVRGELSNTIGYGHFSGEYWNAHSIRTLGGTSAVWSGWCTTPREIDLDNPAVGTRWPIGRRALLPYWTKAAPMLDHDPSLVDFETPLLEGFSYRPVPFRTPTHFGHKYLDRLQRGVIDVVANCSVAGFEAGESRRALTAVEALHHGTGARRRLTLSDRQPLVLAAGGIGNARLLLQPPRGGGVPIGNESGQAGRFLMEHPHLYRVGECAIDAELDRYWPAKGKGGGVHALVADPALSRTRGLYGCSLQCSRKNAAHPMARFLSRERGRPFFHYGIAARSEMRPSAENRVFLTAERDATGLYRAAARCVLDARDLLNVEMSLRALGETLIRLDRGRVRVNSDRIYKETFGGGHIMGTTRMGEDPAASVVDPDCRVHGYGNFFVAGSSVFPTGGGYANPTLTIVALALRLADLLVSEGRR
jgi:hypothetical protein